MPIISTTTFSRPRAQAAERPRVADDVELIGEYQDSGFRDPPYIVRRGDSVVQLTRLLYLVATAADGTRDLDEIAEHVSAEFGRDVSARNVSMLLERKLKPLGLIHGGGEPPAGPPPPLALTTRAAVIPASTVRPIAALFRPLFGPFIVGTALGWLVVLDIWLLRNHGMRDGIVQILREPILALLILVLLLVSTVFHEIGHASACRYGGAMPGGMGVGFYLVWPAFYTDVTDAYRLNRRGRLRTDLGGVYFNCLFVLALAGVYFWTGFEPLLVAIAIQHVQILNQFMPWARLDGYYVLTDLTGVPDILSRIKPILRSLVPDREPEPRVAELKPWVRIAVTAYVITFVAASLFVFVLILWMLPRYIGTAVHAVHRQGALIGAAQRRHDVPMLVLSVLQLGILLFPLIGLSIAAIRSARAAARTVRRKRRVRYALALAVAAVLGGLVSIAVASSPSDARTAEHPGHFPPDEQPTPRSRPAARTAAQPAATQPPQAQPAQATQPQTVPQQAAAAAPAAGAAVPPPAPAAGTALPAQPQAQAAPTAPPTTGAASAPAPASAPAGQPASAPQPAPPPQPAPAPPPPPPAPPPASQPRPGPASGQTTTISATPGSIAADGSSTATITIQARDSSGRDLAASGGAVALSTSAGSLGPVHDNQDGTYSAVLTSGTTPGAAHVTGTIAGRPIEDDASVDFTPVATTAGTTTNTTTAVASG